MAASNDDAWSAVDDYVGERLIGEDAALAAALAANAAAGLPSIDVSASQGKLLHLLVRMLKAERILEIGTLGGYSTIWLARGLVEGGQVTTIEIDAAHAEVAVANFAAAGVADRIELRLGAALDVLPGLTGSYDLAFLDADKPNNAAYFAQAKRLVRPGGVIVVDNVVRGGAILDGGDVNAAGVRALFDAVHADSAVDGTVLQTVGHKGWDGLLIAVVN